MAIKRKGAGKRPQRDPWTKQGFPIVLDVLRTNQSMELTASAVRHVERELKYPVHSLDQFLKLFSRRRVIHLGARTVEAAPVKVFLGEKSFPIRESRELISRLIMAFERERMSQLLTIPLAPRADATQRPEGPRNL